jgi:hypothetical protein
VIAEKTLSSLLSCGVNSSDIFVFLSDPREKDDYKAVLPKDCNVIPGKKKGLPLSAVSSTLSLMLETGLFP